jgi:hypothetical protein
MDHELTVCENCHMEVELTMTELLSDEYHFPWRVCDACIKEGFEL